MLPCMKPILIAIDGSVAADEALEAGLSIARTTGTAATVVHVRHEPSARLGAPFYECHLIEELVRARTVLSQAEARAADLGVEIETEILEGNPARRIIDLAQARGAGLIVVGSRGRGAFTGALFGSVSTELVQRAECPVLVAKQRSRAGLAA
jgi:nucleotide-binding universal stress UspA family protein